MEVLPRFILKNPQNVAVEYINAYTSVFTETGYTAKPQRHRKCTELKIEKHSLMVLED